MSDFKRWGLLAICTLLTPLLAEEDPTEKLRRELNQLNQALVQIKSSTDPNAHPNFGSKILVAASGEVLVATSDGRLVRGGTVGSNYRLGGNYLIAENGKVFVATSDGRFVDSGWTVGQNIDLGGNYIIDLGLKGKIFVATEDGRIVDSDCTAGSNYRLAGNYFIGSNNKILIATSDGRFADSGWAAGANCRLGGNYLFGKNGKIFIATSDGRFVDSGRTVSQNIDLGGNYFVDYGLNKKGQLFVTTVDGRIVDSTEQRDQKFVAIDASIKKSANERREHWGFDPEKLVEPFGSSILPSEESTYYAFLRSKIISEEEETARTAIILGHVNNLLNNLKYNISKIETRTGQPEWVLRHKYEILDRVNSQRIAEINSRGKTEVGTRTAGPLDAIRRGRLQTIEFLRRKAENASDSDYYLDFYGRYRRDADQIKLLKELETPR